MANAGITRDTLLLRMSEDDWALVIETNLTGSYRLAKRAAKGMLRLRRGRIVFVSSVVGLLGSAGQVNYAASKAGRSAWPARSPASSVPARITANVVAPGFVETDMTGVLTDEQKALIKAQVPLGAVRRPEEVASAVTWLAGDGAAYVTGAVIPVDGGLGMGHVVPPTGSLVRCAHTSHAHRCVTVARKTTPVWLRAGALRCTHGEHAKRNDTSHGRHRWAESLRASGSWSRA